MTIFAYNKKAAHDYEILEKFEAGLSLMGFEVKSVKSHRADLTDSYVVFHHGEMFLVNCKIYPLQPKNIKDYQPDKRRKLLLTKKEIQYLSGKIKEKRLTLVPLKIYNKRNFLKLEFALCRSKRKYEKREKLKERTIKREIERSLKSLLP